MPKSLLDVLKVSSKSSLNSLRFESSWGQFLPGEKSRQGPITTTSRHTPGVLYSEVSPTPVRHPQLIAWSETAGQLIDLAPPSRESASDYAQLFSGNKLPPGTTPLATRYGGHQFGHWAHQLGDGRAITLGEILNKKGERWEVQLKGAGPTPYSRHADGRAVLRSSLREFLCSEAMSALGIPTTRALCCLTTGEDVVRDLLYDGNPQPEPGAITTRLAPSFLRFGHFEILSAQREIENLRLLTDFTLTRYFPSIKSMTKPLSEKHVLNWFIEVCERTAHLICEWQRVGFVHGVMNTDNMSILGLTIDYGPYGWLDVYDPQWTPNTTDAEHRRYRYEQQPAVALWNLLRLAEALSPLLTQPQDLESGLLRYQECFHDNYLRMMFKKLGLTLSQTSQDLVDLEELEKLLTLSEVDMTIFFRALIELPQCPHQDPESLWREIEPSFYSRAQIVPEHQTKWITWLTHYIRRRQDETIRYGYTSNAIEESMRNQNPAFILRNYLVQEALDQLDAGHSNHLKKLMDALQTPYHVTSENQAFIGLRPEWARTKPGCSALSCSS